MTIRPLIRLATPADEGAIVEAMRTMHGLGESGFIGPDGQPFPFAEEKTRAAVQRAVARDRAWVGVADFNGSIGGLVMACLVTPFYSDASYLAEQTLFVLPAYRKSQTARLLLKFTVDLASALKAPLAIAVLSNERPEAKSRLYARTLGVKPCGAMFLRHPRAD